MKDFDNAGGKRPMATLEIAASLLVRLSAELLKWQNPGEASGDWLQAAVARCGEVRRKFSDVLLSLRIYVASS